MNEPVDIGDLVRSLATSGLQPHDIAVKLGLHVAQVHRLLTPQPEQAAEMHAARWQEQR